MPTTDGYNGAYTGAQIDEAIGQVRGKNLPADGVKFTDGETFQEKYDSGELTGPRGAKGDKGDKGDTGETGATGPQGPAGAAGANGKSAYEYAQDAGYTGTEEELSTALASLGDLNSILDTINGEVI